MTMDLFSRLFEGDEVRESEVPPPHVFSVAEITREIKILLEEGFAQISVQGEISNVTRHSSGHLYFTLKDDRAQIRCVMWRTDAEKMVFRPEQGSKVITRARVTVYEKNGSYQLVVTDIQPLGVGELQLAFERLKQKLHQEGLFDESVKQPLPAYPDRVGVITSRTGAAIRDIVSVLRRRMPHIQIVLYPVRVQGQGAAEQIAQAIRDFDRYGRVDVLIIGRGGGSLEDLWAFNDEIVARAVFDCRIPVISAVGHEIDFTISDFVADRRAPTPSAAAEMVAGQRGELLDRLSAARLTLTQLLRRAIDNRRQSVRQIIREYGFRHPENRVIQFRLDVDQWSVRMTHAVGVRTKMESRLVDQLQKRLESLNPKRTMARGYAVVRQNGKARSRAAEIRHNQDAIIEWIDGNATVRVDSVQS